MPPRASVRLTVVLSLLPLAACSGDGALVPGNLPDQWRGRDATFVFPSEDLAMTTPGEPPPCDQGDPRCRFAAYGPPGSPFPLRTDPIGPMPDPLENDYGLVRDANGWLTFEPSPPSFNYLWVPNTHDLGDAGTVSKLDTKAVREVARYLSVTCSSLKTGSAAACDGTSGCCAIDDWPRYQARTNKMPEPPHQMVQRASNLPSRTSIDFNGDLFVANEAPGGQASVTHIAHAPASCIDRNKNGRLDTSADSNGNGRIDTDCNGDGLPDDAATVLAKPCTNGLRQEFWGLDDECVLWTSNVLSAGQRVRALGLATGDTSPSDAWAGGNTNGAFVRIDGGTGLAKADAQLPIDCTMGSGPNGIAVDALGVAWVPQQGAGKLCYFDTKKPANGGVVRDPQWGPMRADGITLDRDQNVWVGEAVARYTPDRSNGFNNLGKGWWTVLGGVTGGRIAADSRNANGYFVYSCSGAPGNEVLEIPASTIKTAKIDQMVPNPGWPTIKMPCLGVGLDNDQNVWGVAATLSTRALIDKNGAITQPSVNAPPKGNDVCPAGDSCANPGAEPYSDFTMFGLRRYPRVFANYLLLVKGCTDGNGLPADTEWLAIDWDADVPPNTALTVHARSANAYSLNDPAWGAAKWTRDSDVAPMSLVGELDPNWIPGWPAGAKDGALQLEFTFKRSAANATPALKSLRVSWRCVK